MGLLDDGVADLLEGGVVLGVELARGATRVDPVNAGAGIATNFLGEPAEINLVAVVPGQNERRPDAPQGLAGQGRNPRGDSGGFHGESPLAVEPSSTWMLLPVL